MQFEQLKRREFITLLGGAAATWPIAARGQEGMRRVGMISGIADEAGTRARLAAFLPALQRLGWTEGRNVRFEYRWGNGDTETLRKDAAELAALAPDVIVATGGATTTYMLQATHTVPISRWHLRSGPMFFPSSRPTLAIWNVTSRISHRPRTAV